MTAELLRQIAATHGIAPDYEDVFGKRHAVSDATLRAILAAMHVDATSERALTERARRRHRLPPMTVVRSNAKPWRIGACLPPAIAARPLAWRITSEDGSAGAFT
jgi:hypothetical protein